MKSNQIKITFLFLFLILGVYQFSFAQCYQTLNPGANVASAVSSAPDGSVICLNSGNYGTVNLFNLTTNKPNFVTIRSTTGKGAVISPQVGNSRWIILQNLTIGYSLLNSCSQHIKYLDNTFSGQLTLSNQGCSNLDILIDGNTFFDIDAGGGYEGRLSVVYGDCPSGITISNNEFGNGGCSDGVQIVGNACQVQVGPGNIFSGLLQGSCSAHVDALQEYGSRQTVIDGNYFSNGDTFIMCPDGTTGDTIKNNVFDGTTTSSYIDKIQFGSASNPVFEHNTIRNVRISFDSKTGSSASKNLIARNNILIGSSTWKTSNGSGCTGCTFSNNLYDDSGSARGTDNLIGNPTFVGGTVPSSYAAWKLTQGSLGYQAGNDGKDMGVSILGAGTASPILPTAPTNLRVVN